MKLGIVNETNGVEFVKRTELILEHFPAWEQHFREGWIWGLYIVSWMRRDGNVTAGGKSDWLQDYDRHRQALTWHSWKMKNVVSRR